MPKEESIFTRWENRCPFRKKRKKASFLVWFGFLRKAVSDSEDNCNIYFIKMQEVLTFFARWGVIFYLILDALRFFVCFLMLGKGWSVTFLSVDHFLSISCRLFFVCFLSLDKGFRSFLADQRFFVYFLSLGKGFLSLSCHSTRR